jgi:membrane protein DedA with SNARE-associated domain
MEALASAAAHALITHGYLVILVIMAVEEAGIPFIVPGDGLLLLSGYLVSRGDLSFGGCLLAVVTGAVLGSSLLYWASRRGGRKLILRYGRWIRVEEKRLLQLSSLFERLRPFGPGVTRLIPGLRIYTSALAGLALVPYLLFVLNIVGATALWATSFLWLGRIVGVHWREYTRLSQQLTIVSATGLVLLLAAWWLLKQKHHGRLVFLRVRSWRVQRRTAVKTEIGTHPGRSEEELVQPHARRRSG